MEEKELLKILKEFQKIKPEKDWKFLTKTKILGKEAEIFPFSRPLYLVAFSLLFLLGILQSAQNALPGEPLYSIKKFLENTQLAVLPPEKQPSVLVDLTQKKAEELALVANLNEGKKLVPAIKEFQSKASQTAKVLAQSKEVKVQELKKVVSVLESAKKVEASLGTEVLPPEFDNIVEEKVKLMIEDLEKSSLTEKQKEILNLAKENLKNGKLEEAFLKVMSILNEK